MKHLRLSAIVSSALLAGLLLGACATSGPFAADEEPHATLQGMINKDITDELFPALIAKVDGQVIPKQNRRTYRLSPGEHVIALIPDRDAIQEYEDEFGRNYQLPRIFFEKAVSVNLEEGETYMFGVRIQNYNYADWAPVIEPVSD